jgi:hypothetical protein
VLPNASTPPRGESPARTQPRGQHPARLRHPCQSASGAHDEDPHAHEGSGPRRQGPLPAGHHGTATPLRKLARRSAACPDGAGAAFHAAGGHDTRQLRTVASPRQRGRCPATLVAAEEGAARNAARA